MKSSFSLPLVCAFYVFSSAIAAKDGFIDFDILSSVVNSKFDSKHQEHVSAFELVLAQNQNSPISVKLKSINDFFATTLVYRTDAQLYKLKDYWATPAETFGHLSGDCEDYAIIKYVALISLDIPIEKLKLIYVKARIGRSRIAQAHMVLGYYDTPDAEPLVLDSLVSEILPASKRKDLVPVFSFNSAGIWPQGNKKPLKSSSSRLSRWRNVLERMKLEGINW